MHKIDQIAQWDRTRCKTAWAKLTGHLPGAGLSTKFLRRALAFEAQCKERGGHRPVVRRQLRLHAGKTSQGIRATPALAQGTQLVREWNGRIYRVCVTGDGFELDGQSFTSLSAVAKQITGANWSGPRFFGMVRR